MCKYLPFRMDTSTVSDQVYFLDSAPYPEKSVCHSCLHNNPGRSSAPFVAYGNKVEDNLSASLLVLGQGRLTVLHRESKASRSSLLSSMTNVNCIAR